MNVVKSMEELNSVELSRERNSALLCTFDFDNFTLLPCVFLTVFVFPSFFLLPRAIQAYRA